MGRIVTLCKRVGVLEHVGAHRVAALVVGDDLLFLFRQRERLALQSHQDAVARHVEVFAVHFVGFSPHREQGGLVHEIGEIGAAHPGRAPRDDVHVDVGVDLLVAHVDFQDLDPLVERGQGHHDLTVEAARPQQCGVEDVGAVRGRHHHDALGGLEAVHLREHLVQRLLAFVVTAAEPGAALAADGVDLVDEDDRRRLLLRSLEQVAHAGRAHAHEHLHEVGARDRDEGNPGLAGHGPRDQGLTGAGRPDEQDPLGDPSADLFELARRLQEADDLGDLFFHRAVAGHVGERGLGLVGVVDLGARAPDVHHRAHLSLRAPGDQEPDRADEHEGQQIDEQCPEDVARSGLVVAGDVVLLEGCDVGVGQLVELALGREFLLAVVVLRESGPELAGDLPVRSVVLDARDVVLRYEREEGSVVELLLRRRRAGCGLPDQEDRDDQTDDDPRHPLGAVTRLQRATGPTRPRRTTRRWFRRAPLVFGAWAHE